jgi:hypothetical protein
MARFALHPASLLLLLALSPGVLACRHGDAMESGRPVVNQDPLDPAAPIRLTFNEGEDLAPSWVPDGSGILYSFWEPSRTRDDRCIGVMPVTGGQVGRHRCPTNDPLGDSLDLLVEPAIGPDGRIAWVEQHSVLAHETPDRGAVVVGNLDPSHPGTRVVSLPFVSPSGAISMTATHLRWLSPTRLTYIAADLLIRAVCYACKMDTVPVSHDIMLLDLATGGPPTVVPGTEYATSVWPTADSTGIYYTLGGDTRVWTRSLAGGTGTVVHDFGAIVRDVSVSGNRLAAIVGGSVTFGYEFALGVRQIDSGGVVTTLDLESGTSATHADARRFRHAVLSPDGRSIMAEEIQPPARRPELWLFQIAE